jgi:glucose/mannose-6-phosphate isomerase
LSDHFPKAAIDRVDTMRVRETYEGWPSLARDGFGASVNLRRQGLKKAYVLGMGGSAAGGDIVASWLAGRPGIEMAVFKGQLPIGDLSNALAIACSASGQTEETIEMMKTAVDRGATTVSISSGGKLMAVSEDLGVPHVMMPPVVAPRYMLPFLVFACLSLVNQGLRLKADEEVSQAFSEMDKEAKVVGVDVPEEGNPSKTIALSLLHKTPVIYGAFVTRGAGIRFKNALNENAKVHAHFDGIPDAFHNEIEAWEDPTSQFVPVFLRHSSESPWDREREDKMVAILSRAEKGPVQVMGRGESSLGQLMSMVYRLDMASYYLAVGLGRDPFPIRLIDELKK